MSKLKYIIVVALSGFLIAGLLNAAENQHVLEEKLEALKMETFKAYIEKDYDKVQGMIEKYKNIIKEHPESFMAYKTLSEAYYYLEKHEKYLENAKKALDLNPESSDAYVAVGDGYNLIGINFEDEKKYEKAKENYEKAKEHYQKALNLDSFKSETVKSLAEPYYKTVGERIDQVRIKELKEKADIASKNDDHLTAASYLEKILVLDSVPEYTKESLYYFIGRNYWRAGNFRKSLKSFKKQIKYFPEYQPALMNKYIAESYIKLKEYTKAKKYFGKVLELEPDSYYAKEAKRTLERIKQHLEKEKEK